MGTPASSKGVESVGTCEEECLRLGGRGVGSPTVSCLVGSSVGGSTGGGVLREAFRSYFIFAVGGGWFCVWCWFVVCGAVCRELDLGILGCEK